MNHDVRDRLLAEAARLAEEHPVDLARAVDEGIRRMRRRYVAAMVASIVIVAALATALLVLRAASGPFTWIFPVSTASPTQSATPSASPSPSRSTSPSPTESREPLATGLRIDPASVTMPAGKTRALSALLVLDDGSSIAPSQVEVRWQVAWSSSNERVAQVDGQGIVKGLHPGAATITAVATDPNGVAFTATAQVIVQNPVVVSIQLKPLTLSLLAGGAPGQLSATVTLSDGSTGPLTGGDWVSSDPHVASVTPQGAVRGVGRGTATVTVSVDGVTSPPATITVSVIS
ncbi:Ig-like domain-containing protein [Sinomonas sp. ASV322]|uniref:Ig-like domain-containing protein n=1 Tax=Sinomonas sp. ASV322 TaxID=3041920 RepID=UPI0027DC7BFF|nr:Ig-like domain-containing protein [Sinomonas sp. ASV322]MDQ4504206.1 Ig-like domain-containing protein [Sinomonas sp. ASV322]